MSIHLARGPLLYKSIDDEPEPGDALADLLATLGAAVWHDGADAAAHFVERTGSPPSTVASVDGVVGSIRNKGTGGGYFRTASDAARGTLRTGGRIQIDGTNNKIYALANGDIGISPSTAVTVAMVYQALGNDNEGTVVGTNGYAQLGWYNNGDSGTDLGASAWGTSKTYRINGSSFTGSRSNLRTTFLSGKTLLLIENLEFPSLTSMSYGSASPADGSDWFICNGYLHQLVIIPSAISSGNRSTLESLLMAR